MNELLYFNTFSDCMQTGFALYGGYMKYETHASCFSYQFNSEWKSTKWYFSRMCVLLQHLFSIVRKHTSCRQRSQCITKILKFYEKEYSTITGYAELAFLLFQPNH